MPADPVRVCPECGAGLPAETGPGQCPNCLLGLGLEVGHPVFPAPRPAPGSQAADVSARKLAAGSRPDASPLHSATPDVLLGSVLGDYEVLEEIGHGGMGLVYKARQTSLDRIVALKLLRVGSHASPEAIKRFRAEAVATAALQHPNIVAIHEVGVHQGRHFLVMDLVEGPSLAELIGRSPLPAKRAASYVRTIAEAIHYAHERGILHRDLKPSNILIDQQDQPRVTDFGLARRLEHESELTFSGQVLGSPSYMPPEQALGKRSRVGRPCDVYALGAILYHALTGRPPFVGEAFAETIQQVLNVEPVPLRALNPGVPADLETVCLKCLEKEPAKRYPTAQMLAEELARFLEGKPLLARPVGRLAKAGRWCRRNPRLAGALGAALLSLLLGLAGTTWQWRHAAAERARAEAEALLARRNTYAADMNLVQRALEESDLGRAVKILTRYRPVGKAESGKPKAEIDLRGWEWRYLWGRCRTDEHFTLCQYSNAVTAMAFSPDGKWLAVRRKSGTVALWDTVARRPGTELGGAGWYKALAFSPQGTLLAWGNESSGRARVVCVRDLAAQEEIARLPLSNALVSLAFSPDGQTLASASADQTVRLWEVAQRSEWRQFQGHLDEVWAIAWSPDGKHLVTGSKDGSVRYWDPTAKAAAPYAVVAEPIWFWGPTFLPDRRSFLAVTRGERAVTRWDAVTGKKLETLSFLGTGHQSVDLSSDGRWLALGDAHGNVQVWDFLERKLVTNLVARAPLVFALMFSADGAVLNAGAMDDHVRVVATFWMQPGWREIDPGLGFRARSLTDAMLSRSGRTFAVGYGDGTAALWGIASHRRLVDFECRYDTGVLVALSDNETLFATASYNGPVTLWEAAGRRLWSIARGHRNALHDLAFSPDGQRLVALGTSPKGPVMVWDVQTGRDVATLPGEPRWYNHIGFSPDGNTLFACGIAGPALLYHAPSWKEIEDAENKQKSE